MTRQRYEILCHLRTGTATVNGLQRAIAIPHNKTAVEQSIALRNAGLIEFRGFRARESNHGPRPTLYGLTDKGEAAIQAARVGMAMKDRAIIDLSALEVAA